MEKVTIQFITEGGIGYICVLDGGIHVFTCRVEEGFSVARMEELAKKAGGNNVDAILEFYGWKR